MKQGMMQNNKPRQGKADHIPAAHLQASFSELAGSAALWEPHHPTASIPEMASLPLLFWLVAELRPALTVQIGLGNGTGFLGLCQAIERVGAGGRLLALPIDNETLGAEAAEQHALRYSKIVHLGGSDDETHNIGVEPDPQPVQLLILRPDVNEQMRAEWLARLAPDAVILLRSSGAMQDEAQMDRLKQALPQPFSHVYLGLGGSGFEMFLIGPSLPERVRHLAEDKPFAETMQILFQRLAEGLQHQALARKRLSALQKAEKRLAAFEAQVEGLSTEADAALRAEASEVAKASVLQARIFDLTQDNQKLMQERDDLAGLEARLQEANDGKVKREQVLAEQALKLEEREAELAEARKLAARQTDDIRRLTELAEKHRAAIEKSKSLAAQVASLENEKDELQSRSSRQLTAREVALARLAEDLENARTAHAAASDLAALRQSELRNLTASIREAEEQIQQVHGLVAQKQAEIDALRASTSWRITRPIRKVKDGMRQLIGR